MKQFFEIDKITQTGGHTWRFEINSTKVRLKVVLVLIQGHKCVVRISADQSHQHEKLQFKNSNTLFPKSIR